MAWLAVNQCGREVWFGGARKPYRSGAIWCQRDAVNAIECYGIIIPYHSIIALTGRQLSWRNQPIKVH